MQYSKTMNGDLELIICKDSERFTEIAEKIINLTNAKNIQRIDGLDQSYWDIKINNEIYTIHREHYLGVMIYSKSKYSKNVFKEIEDKLEI